MPPNHDVLAAQRHEQLLCWISELAAAIQALADRLDVPVSVPTEPPPRRLDPPCPLDARPPRIAGEHP
ncbi:hypothetical protein [Tautonia rosea]|uniref:hypothetical protein n=1 Tax=Tautonia rosea TaxID=2728037 RepID=UPI0014743ED9|nr:hypothetical protein [Tautonia rosea]